MATTTTSRPASDKQWAFIDRLVEEKELNESALAWIAGARELGLSSKQASNVIDRLMDLPRKAAASPSTGITEDGMYQDNDGFIFKVQFNREGTRLYAKRLAGNPDSGFTFEYAPGAVRSLTPAMKMSLEQAKNFGVLYGTCCVCGRLLTNEESIQAGIGPICATKF